TNTGTGSVTYTYTPVNNDMVTCALTSSAAFVGGNPAISNQVIMGVNSSPVMVADFSADKLTPAKSDTVLFTDLSTAGAISWSWSFDRPDDVVYLNGTTDHSQNPQVKFTDGGLFTAALATTNGCTSDTRTKTGYIRAGIPGLWSGNTSGDWSVLSNWDDFLEPDGSTDVIIPSSALNWPVFDGNLTLGVNCRSLILSDPTSQMTIIGDLTIP
ncbi:MAG: hypothetical protein NTW16_10850, partial [Bacteroidetes bacterium]|nr:hypothetical protein [Bacteroidota bacterium]